MLWFVQQSLVLLVLAFALGLVTGWLLFGRRRPAQEEERQEAPEAAVVPRPVDLDPARDATPPEPDPEAPVDLFAPRSVVPYPPAYEPPTYQPPTFEPPAHEPAPYARSYPNPYQDFQPSRLTPPGPVNAPPEPAGSLFERPVTAGNTPGEGLVPAAPGGADDLTRIDGITPEVAAALAAAGLTTFRALAAADSQRLQDVLHGAGITPTFRAAYWPLAAADLVEGTPPDAARVTAPADPPPSTSIPVVARRPGALPTTPVGGGTPAVDAGGGTAPGGLEFLADTGAFPRVDDLEQIDGITLKIATALRDDGIVTFADLAEAPHGRLRAALDAAGIRVAPTLPTWGAKARALAAAKRAHTDSRTGPDHDNGVRP